MKLGLHIKTVTGDEFDVWGDVTSKYFPEDGRIYYCDDHSYPANIVDKFYTVTLGAHELYKLARDHGGAHEH